MKFEKFIQENDAKRERAEAKARQVTVHCCTAIVVYSNNPVKALLPTTVLLYHAVRSVLF